MALLTLIEIAVEKQPTICDSNDLADCPLVGKKRRDEIHKYFETIKKIIRKLVGNSLLMRIETHVHQDGSLGLGLVIDEQDELDFSRDELQEKVKSIYEKINEAAVNTERKRALENKIETENNVEALQKLEAELMLIHKKPTLTADEVYALETLPVALEIVSPIDLGELNSRKMVKPVKKKRFEKLEIDVKVVRLDKGSANVYFKNDGNQIEVFNIPFVIGGKDLTCIYLFALQHNKLIRVEIYDVKDFEYRSKNSMMDNVRVIHTFDILELEEHFRQAMESIKNIEMDF